MLYVSDSGMNLLCYYVLDVWKKKPKVIREASELQVKEACISMGGIGESLDTMEQSVHVLE